MYNLLMCALEGTWESGRWALEPGRFLEHTHEAIQAKFRGLTDAAVAELKSLPALFAYERANAAARVGRITEIQRGSRELKISFDLDPAIPPLQPAALVGLYGALDIDPKFEVHRTHWALKEVDLPQVLSSAGIVSTQQPLTPTPIPKVFISYSWDSDEHNQWVAQLGAYLRQQGIDVILDRWYVRGGEDLAVFMEQSVRDAARVLVICTENYAEKAANRHGGVGYEHLIVTTELMQNLGTHKFIPVVRQSRTPPVLPTNLRTRKHFNLSDGPQYTEQRDALVRELLGVRIPIPPLGKNPFG
jgi:hypothetical protein